MFYSSKMLCSSMVKKITLLGILIPAFCLMGSSELSWIHTICSIDGLMDAGIPEHEHTAVVVDGFYSRGDGGQGKFYWSESMDKRYHDGGIIIDPDHEAVPGSEEWYSASSDGEGCWVRYYKGAPVNVLWFGAKTDDDTFDSLPAIQAAQEYAGTGKVYMPGYPSTYYISDTIFIPNGGALIGDSTGERLSGSQRTVIKALPESFPDWVDGQAFIAWNPQYHELDRDKVDNLFGYRGTVQGISLNGRSLMEYMGVSFGDPGNIPLDNYGPVGFDASWTTRKPFINNCSAGWFNVAVRAQGNHPSAGGNWSLTISQTSIYRSHIGLAYDGNWLNVSESSIAHCAYWSRIGDNYISRGQFVGTRTENNSNYEIPDDAVGHRWRGRINFLGGWTEGNNCHVDARGGNSTHIFIANMETGSLNGYDRGNGLGRARDEESLFRLRRGQSWTITTWFGASGGRHRAAFGLAPDTDSTTTLIILGYAGNTWQIFQNLDENDRRTGSQSQLPGRDISYFNIDSIRGNISIRPQGMGESSLYSDE